MSKKQKSSPMKPALAALATFAVLVWGGVGLKVAMLRGGTRQMALAPSSASRPAFDRNAETPRAIPDLHKSINK
jgi:hypothetical protein